MTQTTHTPGPWALDFGAHDAAIHAGATIAMVDDAMTQWRGNAHLIASAPDLLAALASLIEDCEAHGLTDNDAHLREARNAIIKAKGQ